VGIWHHNCLLEMGIQCHYCLLEVGIQCQHRFRKMVLESLRRYFTMGLGNYNCLLEVVVCSNHLSNLMDLGNLLGPRYFTNLCSSFLIESNYQMVRLEYIFPLPLRGLSFWRVHAKHWSRLTHYRLLERILVDACSTFQINFLHNLLHNLCPRIPHRYPYSCSLECNMVNFRRSLEFNSVHFRIFLGEHHFANFRNSLLCTPYLRSYPTCAYLGATSAYFYFPFDNLWLILDQL
jgi:hypothetical protein